MTRQSASDDTAETPAFKIKLSGDGAKMTRLTGFVVISFSLLNDEDAVMSSKGKHVFFHAILKVGPGTQKGQRELD